MPATVDAAGHEHPATRSAGFTLIELLVVVVIIGVLAGIATPMWLAQRRKGVDAGVRSDVRNLAASLETAYVDLRHYTEVVADIEAANGGERVKVTAGNTLAIGLLDDQTYCLRGFNPAGNRQSATNAFLYASDGGGMHTTEDPRGVCNDPALVYTVVVPRAS